MECGQWTGGEKLSPIHWAKIIFLGYPKNQEIIQMDYDEIYGDLGLLPYELQLVKVFKTRKIECFGPTLASFQFRTIK